MLDKATFNGITFIDVDKGSDWSFPDYNCSRIPSQGEIMNFDYIHGNDTDRYFGKVLYVIDKRQMWDTSPIVNQMQDCEIKNYSIWVVMREVKPELGNNLYKSLARLQNLDDILKED